jgi:hypothetical protein
VGNPHKSLKFLEEKKEQPSNAIECDQTKPKPISQNQRQVFVHQD